MECGSPCAAAYFWARSARSRRRAAEKLITDFLAERLLSRRLTSYSDLSVPAAPGDFFPRRLQSASISYRHSPRLSSRKEQDRRQAGAWQQTTAEIPSASRAGESSGLRHRNRARRQRAIKRLRRIMEKPGAETHRR